MIEPYPLKLFKAQVVESSYYDLAPGEEPGTFLITRKSTAGPSATAPPVDDGSEAAEEVGVGLQRGLNLETKPRLTTLSTCSCQFPKFAGMPCRHQLTVITVQQSVKTPEGLRALNLFNPRWKLPSAAEQ